MKCTYTNRDKFHIRWGCQEDEEQQEGSQIESVEKLINSKANAADVVLKAGVTHVCKVQSHNTVFTHKLMFQF